LLDFSAFAFLILLDDRT